MFYIYVIKSESYGNRYVGSTSNVSKRVNEHNHGKCRYTKGRIPWKLVHSEEFTNRSDAMQREKFLKMGQGRKFLDSILA